MAQHTLNATEHTDTKATGVRRVTHLTSPRSLILAGTQSATMRRWARRYGPRFGATRFVAGETMDDCVAVLRELQEAGLLGYAIILGESVTDRLEIALTVEAHHLLVRRLASEMLPATMSLKLTHLGLAVDEDLAFEGAREILVEASKHKMYIRLDMEDSQWVDATLRIYRRLRDAGVSNTGVVLQAYLHRTLDDLRSLLDLELNVRVVKGAYLEPTNVAFASKRQVDSNYLRLIDEALAGAQFTAIATHDGRAIEHVAAKVTAGGAALAGRYELQMLYGVRPQLQRKLAAEGHPVRVCVPYGKDWFVYFGRRLAERPANVLFVLRSLVAR
jgi:proline dehydrogenase